MSERAGESIAKYHDERAGYGGVGWEFHAMAATVCRERDEFLLRLTAAESEVEQLRRERDEARAQAAAERAAANEWLIQPHDARSLAEGRRQTDE